VDEEEGWELPTTIDTFRTILKATDVLANYQDNIRKNVQAIQSWYHNGPGPLQGDLAATQQAVRVFGLAALQAIAPLGTAYETFPAELQAAAVPPLPTFSDLSNLYNLLFTWATAMNTAVFNTTADLDNGVEALLAAVPARMLPF
jgi:hypothetical protein